MLYHGYMGSESGSAQAQEPAASTAERYRDRARSATTLVVTAAGALVAGLVFSPIRDSLSPSAQVSGYISLMFFVISGCFYLQASLYSKSQGIGSREDFTKAVIDSIKCRTLCGSIAGVIAAAAALSVIPLDTYLPEPDIRISVLLPESIAIVPECPNLERTFFGWVSPEDLRNDSSFLHIEVDSTECGGPSDRGKVGIFLDRKSATLTVQPERSKDD